MGRPEPDPVPDLKAYPTPFPSGPKAGLWGFAQLWAPLLVERMASATAGTPTAAQPGPAETIAGTLLSSPAPVPPTTNAAAGAAATDQPEAEQRLVLLMAELEQLASIVHRGPSSARALMAIVAAWPMATF